MAVLASGCLVLPKVGLVAWQRGGTYLFWSGVPCFLVFHLENRFPSWGEGPGQTGVHLGSTCCISGSDLDIVVEAPSASAMALP